MPRLFPALLLILSLALSSALAAEEPMLPVRYEAEKGRVLLEVHELDRDLIYTVTLAGGLGTTSPLLDRGQLGDNALVRFERHGPKVLLIRQNAAHRALTDNEALVRSVEESFPRSVLAAFEIEEIRDRTLVVDATDFILSDVYDAAAQMKRAGRGEAKLDRDRSYVDAERTGAFPRNTEIRAALTFAFDEPDPVLRTHAPDARSVTLEQHHSFLALPDDGYRPREFHPDAGIFPHVFFDFAQGLDTDYRRRWLVRWRLVPSDPEAYLRGELVEPEEPIVYHIDPGIPEPYRSAFIEGGLWFAELFEEAGFKDAFQIRDLPEGADPMDARYNMIHWVHRRERGPSVGPSYRDPRTGEIFRTIVRMDSYRSLVNHDIWMGFRPAAGPDGLAMDSEEMAMARRRQHSAHEIGHTLGLAHNFIAATHGRASVMDYPVPLARLDEAGHLDLSEAYAPGPGDHDRIAIRYAYTWFPDEESERRGLAAILEEARALGLRFITNPHASPAGAFPDATVWVEGSDMLSALERTLAVRRALVAAFDERALDPGEPHWFLNKRFAHVYLHHRSALTGTIKHLGGVEFAYTLAGEGVAPTRTVPAALQRAALERLLETLEPAHLRVPERVARLIPPTPFGWGSGWRWTGEEPPIHTDSGDVFNPLHVAHSLAQEIADGLLHPERANRMAAQHGRDRELPGVDEVLAALVERTWGRDPAAARDDPQDPALVRAAQRAVLDALLDLAGHETTAPPTRAVAERHLAALRDGLGGARWAFWRRTDGETAAHRDTARRDIDRYFRGEDAPDKRPRPRPIPLPWP